MRKYFLSIAAGALILAGCGGDTSSSSTASDAASDTAADTSSSESSSSGSTEVDTYGDDADFDRLWDDCDAGDYDACEELFMDSPLGSGYESFALDRMTDLGLSDDDASSGSSAGSSSDSSSDSSSGSDMTMGQRNAVSSAEDYLAVFAFSRTGLIEQLEFEGYSTDDATFAVDSLNVDWNEEAARSAQEYLDTMSFSRDGLIEQLEFEGFTRDEAIYGVTAVGY